MRSKWRRERRKLLTTEAVREYLGYRIKRAYSVIQADLSEILAQYDLRIIPFSALSVIIARPGLRQSNLSDVLAIERPNLVVILDGLEQAGWITRERIPEDRRAWALLPTDAGKRIFEKAAKSMAEHEARIMEGADSADIAAMQRVLDRIEDYGRTKNGHSVSST